MAHAVVAMDKDRRLHLIDLWHDHCSLDAAVSGLFMIHDDHHRDASKRNDRLYGWFIERDQSSDVHSLLDTKQRERSAVARKMGRSDGPPSYLPLKSSKQIDLIVAARKLQAAFENETLILPTEAPWLTDVMSELMQWPAVPFSSRVGALAALTSNVDQMAPPRPAKDAYRPFRHVPTSWMAQ